MNRLRLFFVVVLLTATFVAGLATAGASPSVGVAAGAVAGGAVAGGTAQNAQEVEASRAMPVLAYYYIWYNPSTWRRAKTDYPLLGTYSSDETAIMRRHIQLAKSAGIEGFLVSWKDTPTLTPRLDRLVGIAREQNFSLGVVYQGLDFARQPINIEKVRHDLVVLADRYSADPVFDLFGPPVVIWTGTKKLPRADMEYALEPVKGRLTVLASAGDVADYERVADLFQGNAHYWSSVNPAKTWYPERMQEMSDAVHAKRGLLVAPATPGFDARLVGGKSIVPRNGTKTLALELEVAAQSGADAIGLISWNEFSENSHVEPSENFGNAALKEVARFVGKSPEDVVPVDSSAPASSGHAGLNGWAALLVTTFLLGAVVVAAQFRSSRGDSAERSVEGYGW